MFPQACVILPSCALFLSHVAAQPPLTVRSPGGDVELSFDLIDRDGVAACPVYRVRYRGQAILAESPLGLSVEGASLDRGLEIVGRSETERDEQWHPVYGERSTVRDHYRQLEVELREGAEPHRRLVLTFRAYDAGVAFCYTLPAQPGIERATVVDELTGFCFTADHRAWVVGHAQGKYSEVPLSAIRAETERPLTVRVDDATWVALGEARLVDYARMRLRPLPALGLQAALAGPAHAELPFTTPWRVVMVADSPGRLLEQNDIFLNLNEPCAVEDTSWIRPGKVIREVTLTTQGGKACVDFAAAHGLQYVEFDAGWYGHEYDGASDATSVTVDPKRSPGPLDLPDVIAYAKARGIGILLYVNRRALERQLDEVLPLFRRWGVAGVKYGFVQVGSQRWTAWLHDAVRKAAEYQLMVDVHDEYRPTGFSRTYPNLMTQEGIAGDETSPTSRQTLTILFTRMLAGAGDNTVCYYDPRVDKIASHGYQLAKAVCVYSPWQFLYWYDRPEASPREAGGAGGSANLIGDEPELEFFARLPTVWDDTRVLHGKIGEYAAIARRSGAEWFVGCMNGETARTLDVALRFLPPGEEYVACIYSDDEKVPTRTRVKIERFLVDAETVLAAAIAPSHGVAIRLRPAREGDRGLPRYE